MIDLIPEGDPAELTRTRLRVEHDGTVLGYLVEAESGWWTARGPGDVHLSGYSHHRTHPSRNEAMHWLAACTGLWSRILRLKEEPHARA